MDKNKQKPDTDCMKKATTDGITKGLTYFGFNADVFLGKFDDNKYVAELEQEEVKKKQAEEKRKKAETWVNGYLLKLEAIEDKELTPLQTENSAMLKRIADGYPDLHKVIIKATDKGREDNG